MQTGANRVNTENLNVLSGQGHLSVQNTSKSKGITEANGSYQKAMAELGGGAYQPSFGRRNANGPAAGRPKMSFFGAGAGDDPPGSIPDTTPAVSSYVASERQRPVGFGFAAAPAANVASSAAADAADSNNAPAGVGAGNSSVLGPSKFGRRAKPVMQVSSFASELASGVAEKAEHQPAPENRSSSSSAPWLQPSQPASGPTSQANAAPNGQSESSVPSTLASQAGAGVGAGVNAHSSSGVSASTNAVGTGVGTGAGAGAGAGAGSVRTSRFGFNMLPRKNKPDDAPQPGLGSAQPAIQSQGMSRIAQPSAAAPAPSAIPTAASNNLTPVRRSVASEKSQASPASIDPKAKEAMSDKAQALFNELAQEEANDPIEANPSPAKYAGGIGGGRAANYQGNGAARKAAQEYRSQVEHSVHAKVDTGVPRELPSRERRRVQAAFTEASGLRKRIAALERQLEEANHGGRIAAMENASVEKDREISRLKAEIRTLQRTARLADKELNSKREGDTAWEQKLRQRDEDNRVLKNRLRKYKELVEDQQKTIKNQQDAVISKDRKVSQLVHRVKELNKFKDDDPVLMSREIESLKVDKQQLLHEVEVLKRDKMSKEKGQARARKGQAAKVEELRGVIHDLRLQLEAKEKRIRDTEAALRRARHDGHQSALSMHSNQSLSPSAGAKHHATGLQIPGRGPAPKPARRQQQLDTSAAVDSPETPMNGKNAAKHSFLLTHNDEEATVEGEAADGGYGAGGAVEEYVAMSSARRLDEVDDDVVEDVSSPPAVEAERPSHKSNFSEGARSDANTVSKGQVQQSNQDSGDEVASVGDYDDDEDYGSDFEDEDGEGENDSLSSNQQPQQSGAAPKLALDSLANQKADKGKKKGKRGASVQSSARSSTSAASKASAGPKKKGKGGKGKIKR